MPVSTILESAVVLPSVKSKGCDYLKMKENVQGIHLCSSFSHKYFFLTALYMYVVSPKIIMHLLFMYSCMFTKSYIKMDFIRAKKESEPT